MVDVHIRAAGRDDVGAIVGLLTADPVSATREAPGDLTPYLRAFDRLAEDPAQELVVAERDGEVVGTLQLSVLDGLSRQGGTRAQLESVHVRGDVQGHGIGRQLVVWAVEEAERRGCGLVQLTSHRSRTDAHGFYERLGFDASHVGFKRQL